MAEEIIQNGNQDFVNYQTNPSQYRHWEIKIEGNIAYLLANFDENGGIRSGYQLKLNSYDLGVDIELYDAINRIRFENPSVRCVILTSLKDRIFCSGANIFMLGLSDHGWKVNFCKFTNETRNGMEDSSHYDGLKFIAALNGACAGGGYELALACDEIILVDDRASAVSLPEVPLLGVLPGTGGLTRLTDKRKVRHDLADIFCTTVEGVRGQKAIDWKLVDAIAKPASFESEVKQRAQNLATLSPRDEGIKGIKLNPLIVQKSQDGLSYSHLNIRFNHAKRTAEWMIFAPKQAIEGDALSIQKAGDDWYPLALARQLDDAILELRTNHSLLGSWIFRTSGDAALIADMDKILLSKQDFWLVREAIGYLRRSFNRLEVTSRSLFAFIETESCFCGSLFEVALACDRIYMMSLPDDLDKEPKIMLSQANFGTYPMITQQSRLESRFYGDQEKITQLASHVGNAIMPDQALSLGLVTAIPDDLDWEDEIRLLLEERSSLSPDSLTGMEANLRFNQNETMTSRVFSRLTAWQNWIFQRPNAVGEKGALKLYGKGEKPQFNWERV